MSQKTEMFMRRLLFAVPALRQDWDQEVREYEALSNEEREGIPEPPEGFLLKLPVDLVHRFATGDPGHADTLRSVLDFFEAEYGTDREIDELIADSFIESLPEPGERNEAVLDMLGPKLHAERDRKIRGGGTPTLTSWSRCLSSRGCRAPASPAATSPACSGRSCTPNRTFNVVAEERCGVGDAVLSSQTWRRRPGT